jgi:hypothetical protein
VELLVSQAKGEAAGPLSHRYSSVELEQVLSVLRKLVRAQQVVLACNQAYIASAAQSEESRTEPPFLLQGSYRNLNKLAARIVPVMNDAELEAVIDDHYRGEAQTLGSAAEGNLLKLKELRGTLSAAEAERWAAIKSSLNKENAIKQPKLPISSSQSVFWQRWVPISRRPAAVSFEEVICAVSPARWVWRSGFSR